MKRKTWKTICILSLVMTFLVLARCVATAVRELYYGRNGWMDLILQDPWLYVGGGALFLVYISAIAYLASYKKAYQAAQS